MEILETKRLLLRPFTLDDSDFILELLNTEGWIKYIGDRNIKTNEQARNYLENGPLKSYQTNGFGLSLVQLKTNNKSIGMCGLIKRDYLDHADIGFAFLPKFWAKGYAVESAAAVMNHAREVLALDRVLAITSPDNEASAKLLGKIGLKFQRMMKLSEDAREVKLFST